MLFQKEKSLYIHYQIYASQYKYRDGITKIISVMEDSISFNMVITLMNGNNYGLFSEKQNVCELFHELDFKQMISLSKDLRNPFMIKRYFNINSMLYA